MIRQRLPDDGPHLAAAGAGASRGDRPPDHHLDVGIVANTKKVMNF
jgi:hypothetical protein